MLSYVRTSKLVLCLFSLVIYPNFVVNVYVKLSSQIFTKLKSKWIRSERRWETDAKGFFPFWSNYQFGFLDEIWFSPSNTVMFSEGNWRYYKPFSAESAISISWWWLWLLTVYYVSTLQDGLNWLSFLNRYNLHGILCDDMGLGKTLQTICILASDHHERTAKFEVRFQGELVDIALVVACYCWGNVIVSVPK